ncbi:GDSL family lipase [Sphingomonas deserti]|uniref:GDSL family lipase n=2 Tax=Allosphingosinicella deserti TaxID=2116704 RepID=A0A2P7QYM3_9SPHN|nr:GDSL family lipase [Sphingomonas deserti]
MPMLLGLLLASASPAEALGRCWLPSWASAQQIPEERNALPTADLADATLRQIVRVTLGGKAVRLRISNQFGTAPLRIGAAHVALSADPATPRLGSGGHPLTFGGRASITVPAGADYLSDPVALAVPPLSHLAVSLYLPEAPSQQTSHPGSRATSYLLHGNAVGAGDMPGAKTVAHWYQLAAVEVDTAPGSSAIVALGDSITDGYGVQPDTDLRWPDHFARRLQDNARTRLFSVLNHGIGGNRLLADGVGPNAMARFERAIAQPGVSHVLILEGVNDLGTLGRDGGGAEAYRDLSDRMIVAYAQMVRAARARGVRAIGATIMPYGGSDYYRLTEPSEAARQAVNAWIRSPGNFDGVVDFDAIMRDPTNPQRLRPDVDSGDHLHPSLAGYRKMADAVPLSLFSGRGPQPGCRPTRD